MELKEKIPEQKGSNSEPSPDQQAKRVPEIVADEDQADPIGPSKDQEEDHPREDPHPKKQLKVRKLIIR